MNLLLPSGEKDEVLDFNAGFLWVALLFFAPTALLLFALSAQIGPFIPFSAASLVILLLLIVESRRPTYPFRFLQSETPPERLTDQQRRVLTFLRSAEALRSKRRLCGALILVTALATGIPPVLGKVPHWVSYYFRIPPDQVLDASVVILGLALLFQALATYTALLGWGCWRALERWDYVQATYEPWPLVGVAEAFRIVSKSEFTTEKGPLLQPPRRTHPKVPLRPSTPVSGLQVLAVVCFMLGGPALFVGGTSLARVLVRGGASPGSGVGLDLGLVVAGLALLWIGGYLWRR